MSPTRRQGVRLWIVGALLAGGALAGVVYLAGSTASNDTGGEGAKEDGSTTVLELGTTGAQPGRLREGAKQVGDPATARAVAREALARVEAEMAAAQGAQEVQRLQRKRALILHAMERLGATPDR